MDLDLPLSGRPPLRASRYQQNGYQGVRSGAAWIVPTVLPINGNVDRGLCSESQLLAGVCEELSSLGAVGTFACTNSRRLLREARGWLSLFVTGAPCLSCVGAMRQFQLHLPRVALTVSIGRELQHWWAD
mmetsp:Transcript_1828/g.4098  ORF Transcript_1828/g.4098 Transcript_1828/m.4098 type:complete len:130 (-) Transcript_1828:85-474(-)